MSSHVANPPSATALMTSARSFGNYDLAGALADLIDNSIKAKAKLIKISCFFNDGAPTVRLLDDGCGMTADELTVAMRPASSDPRNVRPSDDLGRFGWGMKSASFSQCSRLTVLTRKVGVLAGAAWDLDDIDDWKMEVISEKSISQIGDSVLLERDGTEIVWNKCDRLSECGSITSDAFNDLIVHAKYRLALVFHKYLSGEAKPQRLSIELNGQKIEPYDPFHRLHEATQQLELEELPVAGQMIAIRPYILPHFSKLKTADHLKLGGIDGFLRNQGFYVYRNDRLIIHGTWFGLAKFGELSQLIRISIDIPNSLDDVWKITVDKSDAQLPTVLKSRLRQIVDRLKGKSSKVFRSKGGRVNRLGESSIWSRYVKNGEIRYSINREHPIIAQLILSSKEYDRGALSAALKFIEQSFPVAEFVADSTSKNESLSQSESRPERFIEMLNATLPMMLARHNGKINNLISELKVTEPFSLNWAVVQDFLENEGWIR
jgi:hypothetical protein